MTRKEELEILRGEPIKVFTGDPMDVPCIETSDPEKLCRHPVVSVQMITFNHEPYIRQAIEGVMMQKTDFEFELIIGEDCSQDKTREICFEYQKKYPDKIRVLWWYENVAKLGGNGRRCRVRCRGEFIAFCEGDDYWIDPLKLQKQVDVMRANQDVGFCYCNGLVYSQSRDEYALSSEGRYFHGGRCEGNKYVLLTACGFDPYVDDAFYVLTASCMLRKKCYERARCEYDIFNWALRLGDVVSWLGVASVSDVYFLSDVTTVYRLSDSGVSQNLRTRNGVLIDAVLVRFYFARVTIGLAVEQFPGHMFRRLLQCQLTRLVELGAVRQQEYVEKLKNSLSVAYQYYRKQFPSAIHTLGCGTLSTRSICSLRRWCDLLYIPSCHKNVLALYRKYGIKIERQRLRIFDNKRHLLFLPFRLISASHNRCVRYFSNRKGGHI